MNRFIYSDERSVVDVTSQRWVIPNVSIGGINIKPLDNGKATQPEIWATGNAYDSVVEVPGD